MEFREAPVDICQGDLIGIWQFASALQRDQLRLVNFGAAQEPRFSVIVMKDDLQNQQIGLPIIFAEPEKQAVFKVEPGAVLIGPGHFLYLCRTKVAGGQFFNGFIKLLPKFSGVQAVYKKDIGHGVD